MNESLIDFENHIIKCRCCLKDFEIDDTQIKITQIVKIRFFELTSIDLRTTENYSSVICENCNNELRGISAYRRELIDKQTSLYELVDGWVDEPPKDYEDDIVYEAPPANPPIKCEQVSDEVAIKTEHADSENIDEEYSAMFLSSDYLESLQETEEAEEQFDGGETSYVSNVKKSKDTKKHYKRALCGLCGNSYYKDQLQRHIDKVHYKVKRFFCDLCGFGAFLKCNLSSHMGKHIAKEYREQILCSVCPAVFTRTESLKNHMKTEHDQNSEILKCFCGKEFNLRHKLTTHIKRTHNNTRDHACDQCPKRFFTPKELRVHVLKIHTPGYVDKSEHFCEICGKRYSSTKSLRTHMKHHLEPEFKCNFEGCNKGFITKLLLSNHEKIHLGQRDFMCHLCEKSFFSANHLRRHIAVSHDKVRASCFVEGCRFSVGRKDYLRNHILSHRELSEEIKNVYLVKIRDMKL